MLSLRISRHGYKFSLSVFSWPVYMDHQTRFPALTNTKTRKRQRDKRMPQVGICGHKCVMAMASNACHTRSTTLPSVRVHAVAMLTSASNCIRQSIRPICTCRTRAEIASYVLHPSHMHWLLVLVNAKESRCSARHSRNGRDTSHLSKYSSVFAVF